RAICFAAALVFGLSSAAQAVPGTIETFTFTGTCTDCGPGQLGIGTLTLQNYTLGNPIDTTTQYVSWNYNSILLTQSLTSGSTTITGTLPLGLPSTANIEIDLKAGNIPVFQSTTFLTGQWCAGDDCDNDFGSVSSWSAAPLPAALPLFATGIGAM